MLTGNVRPRPLVASILAMTMLGVPLQATPVYGADWSDNQITDIKDRVAKSKEYVNDISGNLGSLSELEDFVGRVEGARNALTDDVLVLIEQARLQTQSALTEQREGFAEFAGNDCDWGTPCDRFKADLTALFDGLQGVSESLLQINQGLPGALGPDLRSFASVIVAASPRAIYPLYVAMGSGSNLFEVHLGDFLNTLRGNIDAMGQGLRIEMPALGGTLPTFDVPDRCPVIMEVITPERFQRAQRSVFAGSIVLTALGAFLESRGETGFEGVQLGVHGYIGATLSNNAKKQFGLVLGGVGDSLGMISDHAKQMLQYCTLLEGQQQLLEFVENNQFPGVGPDPQ